jgi:hypothetical protein
MQEENAKLSCKDAFQVLEGWKNLVQIEQHPKTYQGKITALAPDTGTVTFSARVDGEQKPLIFRWGDADFERFPSSDPGEEWEETLVVFPHSGELITLRKWKTS